MINKQELKEYYEARLKHKLRNLESMRQEAKWLRLFAWLGLAGSAVAVAIGALVTMPHTPVFLLLVALSFGFTGIVSNMARNRSAAYKERFKNEIVSIVVNLIDPAWTYHDKGYVVKENYYKSGLFQQDYNYYMGKSLVTGIIDKTMFSCSELHTGYQSVRELNTIFQGLFFYADFHKHFKGSTYVYRTNKRHRASTMYTQGEETHLIKLENQVFNKIFMVYSSDPVEARYILTPAMMEAILNIVDKYGWVMHFSFRDSRIFCGIYLPPDIFEPKIFRSRLSFEDVYQVYELFNLNKVIVKEMNLNARIWTKK